MAKNRLKSEYFDWMYQLVYNGRPSYRKLFKHLHDVEFTYTVRMDANRAGDGIDLRFRFGYEYGYDRHVVEDALNDRHCSVFEMMAALAVRCEEHIMDDPGVGDRTGKWFWDMIKSLGLQPMDDANYDKSYTDGIVARFLNREYQCDGKGGLFTVEKCRYDMRNAEIWYQMCWYLDSIL